MRGRHSVMLRPDSVRRVRPPKMTMPKTLDAEARSQRATLWEEVEGKDEEEDLEVVGELGLRGGVLEVMLWERAPRGEVDDEDWKRE